MLRQKSANLLATRKIQRLPIARFEKVWHLLSLDLYNLVRHSAENYGIVEQYVGTLYTTATHHYRFVYIQHII